MEGVTLLEHLPAETDPDAIFEAFVEWNAERGLTLYPAQEEALIEVVSGNNVILATPTGSGKSLVAAGAHFAALARDERSFYTAPIKALVSEKFFDLCAIFGTENVGMMTGDARVNPAAPIICCTAEILANIALRDGAEADVGQVVMDEFHFYSEPGPRLGLAGAAAGAAARAVHPDVGDARRHDPVREGPDPAAPGGPPPWSSSPSGRCRCTTPTGPRRCTRRWRSCSTTKQAPVYVVHFTQAAAMERAQALMSINMCTKAEKEAIAELIGDFRFTTRFGRALSRLVRHGIGVHHAGMLPEVPPPGGAARPGRPAEGHLRHRHPRRRRQRADPDRAVHRAVASSTATGCGGCAPASSTRSPGAPGRAGFDTVGYVVCQAPEHVIENERALAKAGDDPKKRRKVRAQEAARGVRQLERGDVREAAGRPSRSR